MPTLLAKHVHSLLKCLGAMLVFVLLTACQGDDFTALTPDSARTAYNSNPASFLDVRTQAEWDGGHLVGAEHIPLDKLEKSVSAVFPDKDQAIVAYCRSGRRASNAAQILKGMGYSNISVVVAGGYAELRQAGYPVEER
ncbi:rhodanese-like domain-containing protein [Spongiibacter sp. KMU-158]|uniref:Rhodanese-like domain-containing protein n=1 Tax=Spongiibacter pelagi TaxID=2760804 RepID=A0A927C3M3_9GAMM|nr:rhodanese-like domain-containing protein [Spongiibacter pelagi]MBD2859402.1 rhodanese-like domain-containing protein [Spongiibacter pelagi]